MPNKHIELLAPAGNTVIGRSAITAGADAVYIGGPTFGARQAAGNPMDEIAELTKFAHAYNAKVYLTMNTILFDNEIQSAQSQAQQAWEANVDALIIQDPAYLLMDLPPIPLHSSTQMFNMSVDKVLLWEKLGFERVVLERALTLEEIGQIRATTSVELEAFIHGAICVGYSGQCYLSYALCNRGGNRGSCAQSCRSSYNLYDGTGAMLARDEQILSVGDLNLSDRIGELIKAGVTSLKIEGRLKDESYVVNNTAYYNRILCEMGVSRSSSGESIPHFTPDPQKSFSRRATHYFFDDPRAIVGAASKSQGEPVGTVLKIEDNTITIKGKQLNNGDGLCWVGPNGAIEGINVNRVNDQQVEVNNVGSLSVGSDVFRNFDAKFKPTGRDVERRIAVQINISEDRISARDVDGYVVEKIFEKAFDVAKNGAMSLRSIKDGLIKSGDTIFSICDVYLQFSQVPFIPSSTLNALRRDLLNALHLKRLESYKCNDRPPVTHWPEIGHTVDYLANISNQLSRKVYENMGCKVGELSLELQASAVGREVLRTRFCIRRERGICPREGGFDASPLMLENNGRFLEARFHCATCEMLLVLP